MFLVYLNHISVGLPLSYVLLYPKCFNILSLLSEAMNHRGIYGDRAPPTIPPAMSIGVEEGGEKTVERKQLISEVDGVKVIE